MAQCRHQLESRSNRRGAEEVLVLLINLCLQALSTGVSEIFVGVCLVSGSLHSQMFRWQGNEIHKTGNN